MTRSGITALRQYTSPLGSMALLASAPAMLAFALLSPPAHGQMLVIPVTTGSTAAVARMFDDPSIRLMGAGPTRGSLIVFGPRSAVRDRIGAASVLILAVPDAGCLGANAA